MPTTTVVSPAIALPQRRRIAKELAFWWRRAGVDINHAITRFTEVDADTVYSGPLPMDGAPFAFVHCVVAADRDTEFKARYVAQVRRSLAEIAPAARVFVSFQPTDPNDHFVAVGDDPTEEGTA